MTLSPPKPEPLYCLSLRQGTVTTGRYSGTRVHSYMNCATFYVLRVCVSDAAVGWPRVRQTWSS